MGRGNEGPERRRRRIGLLPGRLRSTSSRMSVLYPPVKEVETEKKEKKKKKQEKKEKKKKKNGERQRERERRREEKDYQRALPGTGVSLIKNKIIGHFNYISEPNP